MQGVLKEGESNLSQETLDGINLTDDTLYKLYGDKIYDTSKKLHKTAKIGEPMISRLVF